ncbi:MAG: hypothetical protein NTW29_17050 [Bacteroidetes bacterium]|nr:hypothetical protein [Bacteroidota bacterium]
MAGRQKIRIPEELKLKVQHVCQYRPGNHGLYGPGYIVADLKQFIEGPLRKELNSSSQKKGMQEKEILNNKKLFDYFEAMNISRVTLQNAFGEKGVSANLYFYLPELLKRYVEAYIDDCPNFEMDAQITEETVRIPGITIKQHFSPEIVEQIKSESGNFCMFENCHVRTELNSAFEDGKVIGFGTANMIYGSKKGEPRFVEKPPLKIDSAENGLWLCINHSVMVNAFQGTNYKTSYLMGLKETHRILLNSMSDGKSKVVKMALNFSRGEKPVLNKLLEYIGKQEFLFTQLDKKSFQLRREQMTSFICFLSETIEMSSIDLSAFILKEINGLKFAFEELLKNKKLSGTYSAFSRSYMIIRKLTGLVVSGIAKKFHIRLSPELLTIVPQIR